MTIQDLMSVVSGSGGGALISGFMVWFVKRMLVKYDERTKDQYKKMDQVKESMSDLRVQIGIISTQVEGLTRLIDKINSNGCKYCRNRDKD